MLERLKAPDRELRSKVAVSITGHASYFSPPIEKTTTRPPSVRVKVICCDSRWLQ